MPRDETESSFQGTVSAQVEAGSEAMAPVRVRISSLQQKLGELPPKVRLSSVRDEVGDVGAKANRVAALAKAVREMGYAWENDLEPRCLDYRQRWQNLKPDIVSTIDRESASLQGRQTQVEYQVNWGIQHANTPETAASALPDAERVLDSLESDADAAESSVRGMFNQFSTDLSALEDDLNQVRWMMDRTAQSRVNWLPHEAMVLTVQAKWDREGKDDPSGMLFLSDQRVIFERDEDVATKKVLFMATAKQHVQEVMMDLALPQIASVEASKRNLMGHEDHLEFTFHARLGAPSLSLANCGVE